MDPIHPTSGKEPLQHIDWKHTKLYENLQSGEAFNQSQDPRYLTEDQIVYCINLLRYCRAQFTSMDRLRQMFSLTIATTQLVYQELGLTNLFHRLSESLDNQEVMDILTCE